MDLRDYQVEGLERALDCMRQYGGFAIFCEQRTGKTHLALAIAEELSPDRLLIVGPEKSIQVWEAHLKEREFVARTGCEVKVMTRDTLYRNRSKLIRWIQGCMVIADELHEFKGKNSKRSRALRSIVRKTEKRQGAKYRLGLTGTPQEAGLEDYWPQFDFTDPSLFGEWSSFQANYLIYGGYKGKKIIGYRNQERFRRLMHSRSYRVLLEEVKEKPTDISHHKIYFDLNESRQAYDEMYQKFLVEVNTRWVNVKELQADGTYQFVRKKKRIVAPRAITQAMKLHQLSGGFIMDEEGTVHRFGNEKLTEAGCLMLELGIRTPQVWFVRFIPELYRLEALFKRLGRDVTLISGKHKDYVSGTPFDIAIVQIQSGKSIDLSHAEEAIFYSWDYSYLTYDQAKFRIRSYHGVRARYWYLMARNTIDQDLYDTVTNKTSFARVIIDRHRQRSRTSRR